MAIASRREVAATKTSSRDTAPRSASSARSAVHLASTETAVAGAGTETADTLGSRASTPRSAPTSLSWLIEKLLGRGGLRSECPGKEAAPRVVGGAGEELVDRGPEEAVVGEPGAGVVDRPAVAGSIRRIEVGPLVGEDPRGL